MPGLLSKNKTLLKRNISKFLNPFRFCLISLLCPLIFSGIEVSSVQIQIVTKLFKNKFKLLTMTSFSVTNHYHICCLRIYISFNVLQFRTFTLHIPSLSATASVYIKYIWNWGGVKKVKSWSYFYEITESCK